MTCAEPYYRYKAYVKSHALGPCGLYSRTRTEVEGEAGEAGEEVSHSVDHTYNQNTLQEKERTSNVMSTWWDFLGGAIANSLHFNRGRWGAEL